MTANTADEQPRDTRRVLYKKGQEPLTVENEEEEQAARADGWVDSPAEYGVETQPAKGRIDPNIAKNRQAPQQGKPK